MRALPVAFVLLCATSRASAQDPPAADPPEVPSKLILAVDRPGHSAAVADFDFTADGKKLFTVSDDNTIQIWDAVTREHLKTLRLPWKQPATKSRDDKPNGFAHKLSALAASPDGRTLAVCLAVSAGRASQNPLYVVDLETGRMKPLPGVHYRAQAPVALTFSGNGDVLAALKVHYGQIQGIRQIHVWRGLRQMWAPKSPAPTLWRDLPVTDIHDIQLSPDGGTLAACGRNLGFAKKGKSANNHNIFLLDLKNADGQHRTVVSKEYSDIRRLAWSPKGDRVAGDGDYERPKNQFAVWSPEGTKPLLLGSISYPPSVRYKLGVKGQFQSSNRYQIPRPLFVGDNEVLLVGAAAADAKSPAVLRFDLKNNRLEEVVGFVLPKNLHSMKIAPDGKRLAMLAGPEQDEMFLLDLEPGAKLQPLSTATSPTPLVAFSKKGYKLAWTGDGKDRTKLIAGIDLRTAERLGPDELKAEDFRPPAETAASPEEAVKKKSGSKYLAKQRSAKGGLIDILTGVRIATGKFAKGDKIAAAKGLLTVFVAGQDWVVCTAQGYYAATPGGEKMVGWHVNNGLDKLASFYPFERFRKKLYRPDVIRLVLDKGDVATAVKVANVLGGDKVNVEDLLPPKCSLEVLEHDKGKVTVRVRAEARLKSKPIRSLRLFLDGRPFVHGGNRGFKVVAIDDVSADFPEGKESVDLRWEFTLPGEKAAGAYRLAVLAKSADASALSNTVSVSYLNPKKVPHLHLLAVGINNYKNDRLNLSFAAKDAKELAAAFAKHARGELFAEVHPTVLLDKDANRKAVLEHLLAVRKKVKENDLFVVFFAGHGTKEKDQFYLLTVEADVNALATSTLSGADLRKALGEFPCQVLLMLDACHSAAFGAKGKRPNLAPATDEATRALTEDEIGVAVMCAAMGHEFALETDQGGKGGNGLFTRAVLNALQRADGVPFNRANRLLYIHHLQAFVFDQVNEQSAGRQHPFLSLPWVVQSFPVAKFAGK